MERSRWSRPEWLRGLAGSVVLGLVGALLAVAPVGAPRLPVEPAAAEVLLPEGLSTVAGNGSSGIEDGTGGPMGTATFNRLIDVEADPSGMYLYVLDGGGAATPNLLRRVTVGVAPDDPDYGRVETLVSGGELGIADDYLHDIEVDESSIYVVRGASVTWTTNKDVIRFDRENPGNPPVVLLSAVNDAISVHDGYLYYAAPPHPTETEWFLHELYRIPLSQLPASPQDGSRLGAPPEWPLGADIADWVWLANDTAVLKTIHGALSRQGYLLLFEEGLGSFTWLGPAEYNGGLAVGPRGSLVTSPANTLQILLGSGLGAITVAGDGSQGWADGTPGRIWDPLGLASSPDGSVIWIADTGNNRIRAFNAGALDLDEWIGSAVSVMEMLGDNPSIPQLCTCYRTAADPVNTASGNLHETWWDLGVPGRGFGLGWSRSYNSLVSDVDGPLGHGWTHRFNLRLESLAGGGIVRVHQESGSQVAFYREGSGYVAAPYVEATLVENTDGTFTFTRRGGRDVFKFSADGRLLEHRDLNGYVTTLGYTGAELTSVTDEAGRVLAVAWSGGRIHSITDPAGRVVTYAYDANGDLWKVTDVVGKEWVFGYDAHRLTSIREPGTTTPVTNVYDGQDRVISQTDPINRKTDFDYTSISTKVTFPDGDVRVDTYEGNLLVASTEGWGSPDAATTTYVHDPDSLGITTLTDPLGHVWTFDYDANSMQILATDPLGRQTATGYHPTWTDLPTSVTRSWGGQSETTTFSYDTRANLQSSSTPLVGTTQVQTVQYLHEATAHPGDVTTMVDPNGERWDYGHDSWGYLRSVTDPEGNETTFAHNNVGWMTETVAPMGNVVGGTPAEYRTTFSNHTAHGDAEDVTNPEGETTHYEFDEVRRLVSVTDAEQRVTTYDYDDAGQLRRVGRADGTALENRYHDDGTLWRQYDGAGQFTEYSYDDLGRLKTVTDPLGRTTTFRYDDASRLETRQAPGGDCDAVPKVNCVVYGYDDADQLTSIDYTDPATPDVSDIGYDLAGRRTQMADGTGTYSWAWDSLGRLTSHTGGAGYGAETVGYGYDGLTGRVETITYPGGGVVTREHDDAGRWVAVTDWDGNRIDFPPDPNGRITEVGFPGSSDVLGYDHADRLTSVELRQGATPVASLDYGRDSTGLVDAETASAPGLGSQTTTYGYSALRQLCWASPSGAGQAPCDTPPEGASTYDHDPADNLVTLGDGTTQAFDVANQLCWSSPTATSGQCSSPPADATVFGYDSSGNRTSQEDPNGLVTSYTYDQADRLVSATVPQVEDYEGQYTPLPNARILDTRNTLDSCNPAPCDRLAGGESVRFDVLGQGGIPATGVEAVVLNLMVWNPSKAGYAKVNRDTDSYAAAALLHYRAGEETSTMAVAMPDASGSVELWTQKATDAIVEVVGYYSTPEGTSSTVFEPVTPVRLTDTRSGVGTCVPAPCDRLAAGETVQMAVAGQVGLPAQDVQAVTVNITAYLPSGSGFLKVNRQGGGEGTAVMGFSAGETTNMTTVAALDANGRISVYSSKATDVVIDVVGYHTAPDGTSGTVFVPLEPDRIAKTSAGEGICDPSPCDRLGQGETVAFQVAGLGGVPTEGAAAVVVSVTIENPSHDGWAKVNRNPSDYSAAATLHYQANQSVNDLVVASLDDGSITIQTEHPADVILDVAGYYMPLRATWTYAYDGDGLRSSRTDDVGVTTTYTWDRSSQVPLLLAETTGSETTRYVYGPGATPIAQINPDGSVLYLHHDQLGSVRVLTDAAGDVAGTYTYDPYGNVVDHTGEETPLQYAGQYTDAETGLQYLRARFYDPSTGQFLTRDPIEPITRSAYAYVGGNPLNATDPNGLNKCEFGANPVRWIGNAQDCIADHTSAPDYIVLDQPLVPPLFGTPFGIGGDALLTITRDGSVYVGVGPAAGLASGSPSVRGGWLHDDDPTDCEINEFVSGWSATANAGWGLSGGETYGFDGTATEVGVGLGPSADASVTHGWEIFTLPSFLQWG